MSVPVSTEEWLEIIATELWTLRRNQAFDLSLVFGQTRILAIELMAANDAVVQRAWEAIGGDPETYKTQDLTFRVPPTDTDPGVEVAP